MLGAVLCPGFSKTARSHPGHGEAGRDGKDELAIPIFGRRLTDDVCERSAESAEASKPNIEADICDTSWGLPEQEHRALHPAALKVPMRRLAKRSPKGPDEVRLRHVRDLGKVGDVERPGIGAIDCVAGSKHPPIELFHGPGHSAMLSGPAQTRPARPPHHNPFRREESELPPRFDDLRAALMHQPIVPPTEIELFATHRR
jgi:hypothetical protein